MNKSYINGIQQMGIGVRDARKVFNWYRKNLGFDILVFRDQASADLMTRYTEGKPVNRLAILAMNMRGGGGIEIWQPTERIPAPPPGGIQLGDLGINIMKLRGRQLEQIHQKLRENPKILISPIGNSGHFFFRDPWDNLIEMVEDTYAYTRPRNAAGGVLGAVLGVSDMQASLHFYRTVLNYEIVLEDATGFFPHLFPLDGGRSQFRRVVLTHASAPRGGFSELFGPSRLELLQVLDRKPRRIYSDRQWGDLGFIHLCYDVSGMPALRKVCKDLDYPFTVDSMDSFDMGEAAGQFSYVEDPDGTLIEFVETHKVPIIRNLGLFLNLRDRDPEKPLPRWMVAALKLQRRNHDLS